MLGEQHASIQVYHDYTLTVTIIMAEVNFVLNSIDQLK